jgi:hypothetical protein
MGRFSSDAVLKRLGFRKAMKSLPLPFICVKKEKKKKFTLPAGI